MKDLIIFWSPIILVLALALLAWVSKKAQDEMRKRGVSERYINAVATIEKVASIVVRAIQQRTVANAKDPSKSEVHWTKELAEAAKAEAVEKTKTFSNAAIGTLLAEGLSGKAVDQLVDDAVEAGVTSLKQNAPVVMTATASSDPPKAEVTTAPAGA